MKLYMVISSLDYEGGHIRGVFTNRKLADNALDRAKNDTCTGDWHDVVTVQADVEIDVSVPYIDWD